MLVLLKSMHGKTSALIVMLLKVNIKHLPSAAYDHNRYIYDVVADHLLCGDTSIPITELLTMAQLKSKKDTEGDNDYAKEHKLLNKLIPR